MNKYGIIYLVKNKINNKCYFGQTINKRGFDGRYYHSGCDVEKVYKYHLKKKEQHEYCNNHLLDSIKSYGHEAFDVIKEFDVAYSKEELDKLEDVYIKIYNTADRKYGYNNRGGGANGKYSEESKQKISNSRKGRFKGQNNPFYGKHHNKHTIDLISKKQTGKKYSQEVNLKKGRVGKYHKNSKKIICLNTKETFDYLGEVEEKYNLNRGHLSECCQRKRHYCGVSDNQKLVWYYYDDYLRLTNKEIQKIIDSVQNISTNNKRVVCTTTTKIYKSISEASNKNNINRHHISECCKDKRATAGKLEDGTKLKWMYYTDYIKEVNQ